MNDVAEIDAAALAPIIAEAETIEVLLLGTGKQPAHIEEGVRTVLAAAGIRLDAMHTGAAARTYNVLIAEDRRVAAALIAVGEERPYRLGGSALRRSWQSWFQSSIVPILTAACAFT